jgi:putative oxidoreductase
MNSKIFMVLRIVFGLFLLVFGFNKFFHFLPMGEMSEAAMNYFSALMSTNTLKVVAIIEILAGISLLLNKYGALMMLVLMTVSVNTVLFHSFLEPGSIGGAIILLVLNVVLLYAYKDKYKDLLNG